RRVEVEAESLYRGYGRTIADDRADLGNAVIGRGGVGLVHARGGAVGQRARRRGGDDDRDGGAGTCGHAADSEGQDAAHGRDPVSGRDEGHARRERVGQGHAGRTRRTVVGHRERISHVIARVTEPGAVLESAKSGAGGSTTWPIGLLVSVLFRRIGLLVSVLLSAKKENNWCQFCFQRKTELTPIIDTNYPPRMHSEMMKGYNRADERAKAVVAEVRAIASEVGWSPAQVALAWLRQRPMSVIPIVGARRLEQFKDNLACLDLTLDGLQVKRLDSASHVESGFPHDLYERDLVKGSSMARCETRSTCDPNRAAGTDGQHVPLHEQDIEEASSLFDVNIKGGVLPHVHEVRDRADAQDRRRGDREHVVDLRAQRLPWLVAVHGHEARR